MSILPEKGKNPPNLCNFVSGEKIPELSQKPQTVRQSLHTVLKRSDNKALKEFPANSKSEGLD